MAKHLLHSIFIFFWFSAFAQWSPTTGPWGGTINAYYESEGTIYAATGNYGAGGVFKSTDDGLSWEICNKGLPLTRKIPGLYGDEDYIYVGIWQRGIFRSDDEGNSWNEVNNGLPENGLSINTIYASDGKVYAGINFEGVYVSADQGDNWIQKNNGLTGAAQDVHAITKSGNTLFIATSLGIYKSDDEGDNWTASSNGIPQTYVYCFDIEIKDNFLFACALNGIYRSGDGGTNWVKLNGNFNAGTYTIAANDNELFAGSAGQIYSSGDDGDNWTTVGTGLPQFAYIYAIYASDNSLLCGLDIYGSYSFNSDNESWDQANSGLMNTRVLDMTPDGNDLFAVTLFADFGRIFKTENDGNSWQLSDSGASTAGFHAIINTGEYLAVGSDGDYIYRSSDHGNSWEHISSPDFQSSYVSCFCQNSDVLFAGGFGFNIDVYRSTDMGATWEHCNVPGEGDITALHSRGNYIFTTRTDGVYRSDDLGISWTHSSNGLPDLPFVNSIGSNDNFLFVASNDGFYRSHDQGDSWELIYDYPYDQRVLCISTADDLLFTGTMKTGLMYSEDNGVNWKSFNPDYFMDPGGTLPNVNAVEIKGDSVYAGYEDFGVWVSVLPTMTGIGEYPDGLNESYLKTYPNPFTTSTTIEYYLDQPETVTIAFYNQFGKQVDKIEQKQSSGIQQVVWTPENLANGIYYFSVQAGRKLASDKVLLMK